MNRKLTGNIISALLLAMFLFAYASSNFFWHKHTVNNTVIVHSHPFSGSPDNPRHVHSGPQIDLITHFTLWLMLAAEGSASLKRAERPVRALFFSAPAPIFCRKQDNPSLRAPPAAV